MIQSSEKQRPNCEQLGDQKDTHFYIFFPLKFLPEVCSDSSSIKSNTKNIRTTDRYCATYNPVLPNEKRVHQFVGRWLAKLKRAAETDAAL